MADESFTPDRGTVGSGDGSLGGAVARSILAQMSSVRGPADLGSMVTGSDWLSVGKCEERFQLDTAGCFPPTDASTATFTSLLQQLAQRQADHALGADLPRENTQVCAPASDQNYSSASHPETVPSRTCSPHADHCQRQAAISLHLESAQRQLLEELVTGMSFEEWLERVCLLFEAAFPDCWCSVQLVENGILVCKSAPNLPAEYKRRTERVPIGPNVGSCGTAAYENQTVIVADIATDARWKEYAELALSYGLRSCWSVPIRGTHREVVGTFAVYSRQPGVPSDEQRTFLDRWSYLVSLAIQREREQRARLASEELYKKAIDDAPEAIFLVDGERGVVLRANRAVERILGYAPSELVNKGLWDISPEFQPTGDRSVELARRYHECALRGELQVFEWTCFHRRGDEVLVEVRLLPFTWQDRRVLRASIIDITRRKQLERRLSEEMTFLQLIMDSVPCHIFLFDTQQRMLRWNRRTEETSGYTTEEIRRIPAIEFIASEDRPRVIKAIQEVFEKGYSQVEAQLLIKSGRRIPFHYRGVRTEIDGTLCVLGIGMDITSQKEMDEKIRWTDKLATIGRLAAGIAHEYNNLLTIILGYSDMLLADGTAITITPQLQRDFLTSIREAASRAKTLTNQILTYGRQSMLQRRQADLNAVIRQAQGFLAQILRGNITLELHLSEEPLLLSLDADQITQMLLNLASNSADAMPGGGTFLIRSQRIHINDSDSELDLPKGDYALVTVSDTGTGIPQEIQKRVFDPFFTTKEPGRGTGLGLSVVLGIVNQHHGRVQLISSPGQGTTFKLYFPIDAGTILEEVPIT